MGKREKKTGKGRLDKYYKLAKEQGYRARSAFKLIQLDKKYDILRTARCLIDLCAAPGGWLQVATKYMPPNSIIVGVDLVPIKPIPRVTTFAEDITTDACRRRLREEIKDWKADVVLHDGAPNVGTAWAQDAFTQSELVLSSMKLATEFLAPGGTFVTKVFRSKDYNSLLWVFNQLFSKVEATKPPSSRNVSAEIFVVCTGFLAPKKIDPRLLNPTHVFKDLDVVDIAKPAEQSTPLDLPTASTSKDKLTPAAFSVFHPDKKRRAREGYNDGDLTLFKRMSAVQFVQAADPISILGSANQLDFEGTEADRALAALPETTEEIKASAVDLRVLGKKDFKTLLRWRTSVRSREMKDSKSSTTSNAADEFVETATVQCMTEDEQMALDIERLETEESAKRRKDRRKVNEKRARGVQRMQLHMTTPMDIGLEAGQSGLGDQGEDFVFDLTEAEGNKGRTKPVDLQTNEADDLSSDFDDEIARQKPFHICVTEADDDISDEDERRLRDLEGNLDDLYDEYQNHKLARDAKHRVKEARKKRDAEGKGEWGGISGENDAAEEGENAIDSEAEALDAEEEANTLAYQQYDPDAMPEDEVFSDASEDEAEDIENLDPKSGRKAGQKLIRDLMASKKPLEPTVKNRAAAMWFDQPIFKGVPGLDALMKPAVIVTKAQGGGDRPGKQQATSMEPSSQEDVAGKLSKKRKHMQSDPATWDEDEAAVDSKEEQNAAKIAKYGLTTAEAMTLAQQLVNREKTKTQLIDDGFNRNMLAADKEGLPAWFLDDEMKHFRHNIPVTKEAVEAIRAKMKTLNARPIKKIAEAKARKKMRTLRRLAKSQKKADVINEAGDLTEREKASQIQAIISKASKEPKKAKPEVKVVVARGAAKGLSGRPKGVKGRYKMVDSRGKKEVRALKRIQRRDAGKRRK